MGTSKQLKSKAISTSLLKDKLNLLYSLPEFKRNAFRHEAHFDTLWDLKEMALLEGRSAIEVPEDWMHVLDELEQEQQKSSHYQ
jgi:hypothetical protein